MIEIKDLFFQYPKSKFKLDIPALEIEKGEKIAIIGPSGSGKTTLLNLLSGILIPDRGSILINGLDIQTLTDNQRRDFRIQNIGFVFQEFELLDYLSVKDNILHPYRITTSLKLSSATKDLAAVLAAKLGVKDKMNRKITQLSQGEKQRVAICRAMLTQPQLIFADEATGNLDPENKVNILKHLFALVEQVNSTLIAVTHDVDMTKNFDRTIDFKTWLK